MLTPIIRAYLILTVQYLISLSFSYVSMIYPNWLVFKAPEPLGFRTQYGLYQQCSMLNKKCRPFPDRDLGDCDESGFCSMWLTARYLHLFSVLIGTLIMGFMIYILFSTRIRQQKAWAIIVPAMGLTTALQIATMSCVAYIFNNSNQFYIGTNYDYAFYLNLSSWILTLSGVATLVGFRPWANHAYEEL